MSDQSAYIASEAQALHDALSCGDLDDATTTAVTLQAELRLLLLELDPKRTATPRITTSNGAYIYPKR